MSLPLPFKEVTSACCTLSKVQRERFLSTRYNVACIEKKITLHQPPKTKMPSATTDGSQTSPMDFYIQNNDFSTRTASHYGSQPSSVALCIHKSDIMTRINSLRPHLSLCASKTTWLASELLVSIGPSPHLRFLNANQRLLVRNYKSLWVPVFAGWFVNAKQLA